jgi:tetratricopeptide (TPR) repeat protein
MKSDGDRATPENWLEVFNECDLDKAFDVLDGWHHFHTDTLRGRVRSLQLRPKEAWKWFSKAESKVMRFENSTKNLYRYFYLKVYCFENSIIESSKPDEGDDRKIDETIREVMSFDVSYSPKASQLQKFCRGLRLLHLEEFAQAQRIFSKLIRENSDKVWDEMTAIYLSSAVALYELNLFDKAKRVFENAALSIPVLSAKFNMGLYASIAKALLKIWGREQEAMEWDGFIGVLKIPPKTIEILQERAERILERSESLNRIFLF